jgi:hypothetical protein
VTWRRSTFSQEGQCVELGGSETGGGWLAVRDSKNVGGPVLVLPGTARRALLALAVR